MRKIRGFCKLDNGKFVPVIGVKCNVGLPEGFTAIAHSHSILNDWNRIHVVTCAETGQQLSKKFTYKVGAIRDATNFVKSSPKDSFLDFLEKGKVELKMEGEKIVQDFEENVKCNADRVKYLKDLIIESKMELKRLREERKVLLREFKENLAIDYRYNRGKNKDKQHIQEKEENE